jgi:hypothetical protein
MKYTHKELIGAIDNALMAVAAFTVQNDEVRNKLHATIKLLEKLPEYTVSETAFVLFSGKVHEVTIRGIETEKGKYLYSLAFPDDDFHWMYAKPEELYPNHKAAGLALKVQNNEKT